MGLYAQIQVEPNRIDLWQEYAESGGSIHDDMIPYLCHALGECPESDGLRAMLAKSLTFKIGEKEEPTPWWTSSGRLGETEQCHYDNRTGMPLHIVSAKSGVSLRWAAPDLKYSEVVAGPGVFFGFPNFFRPDPWIWMSDQITQEEFARLDETYPASSMPVVGVSAKQAQAYSKWSGLELPTPKDWNHVVATDAYMHEGEIPSRGLIDLIKELLGYETPFTTFIRQYQEGFNSPCGIQAVIGGSAMSWGAKNEVLGASYPYIQELLNKGYRVESALDARPKERSAPEAFMGLRVVLRLPTPKEEKPLPLFDSTKWPEHHMMMKPPSR